MTPERVNTIAVMDLSFNNGELQGRLQYYEEPDNKKIHADWDAQSRPVGYAPIHGGIVYCSVENREANLKTNPPRDSRPRFLGDSSYLWPESGFVPGETPIMMILILPNDYSLTGPKPIPGGAKEFDGRLAVNWTPVVDKQGHADVVWTLKKIESDLVSEIRRFTKNRANVPTSSSIQASNTDGMENKVLGNVRREILKHFNLSELRNLCFDLGVNYDDLPGETLGDKARELLSYLSRYSRLSELREMLILVRPNVSWPSFPDDEKHT